MKERGILFSAPMVRAILDGSKTQTRRAIKGATGPFWDHAGYRPFIAQGATAWEHADGSPISLSLSVPTIRCPYGAPGDRLWVRETWTVTGNALCTYYRADNQGRILGERAVWQNMDSVNHWCAKYHPAKWHPAIHMPRWASRIVLDVTSVRVERLHDITEEDARAEGATVSHPSIEAGYERHARDAFQRLWYSINGAESWDANPWVWVVTFRRVTP